LLALLDDGADSSTIAEPFGAWCDHNIEPWVADHIAFDGCGDEVGGQWDGEVEVFSLPAPDHAAVEADPRIGQHAAGYFAMTAPPHTLKPAEPLALGVYRNGWRPTYAPGPTRNELVHVIRAALPPA
jgi:hypothetical protein